VEIKFPVVSLKGSFRFKLVQKPEFGNELKKYRSFGTRSTSEKQMFENDRKQKFKTVTTNRDGFFFCLNHGLHWLHRVHW